MKLRLFLEDAFAIILLLLLIIPLFFAVIGLIWGWSYFVKICLTACLTAWIAFNILLIIDARENYD